MPVPHPKLALPLSTLIDQLGGGISPETVRMLELMAGVHDPGQARLEFLG